MAQNRGCIKVLLPAQLAPNLGCQSMVPLHSCLHGASPIGHLLLLATPLEEGHPLGSPDFQHGGSLAPGPPVQSGPGPSPPQVARKGSFCQFNSVIDEEEQEKWPGTAGFPVSPSGDPGLAGEG